MNVQPSHESSARLDALKSLGAQLIPADVPGRWRAVVIEKLEEFVTTVRFPHWISEWQAQQSVSDFVQAALQPFRDEAALVAKQRDAERQVELRVFTLSQEGMRYARDEVRDGWDWGPRNDALRIVEEELRTRVNAGWTTRQVRALVDEVLAEWDDDEDDEDDEDED